VTRCGCIAAVVLGMLVCSSTRILADEPKANALESIRLAIEALNQSSGDPNVRDMLAELHRVAAAVQTAAPMEQDKPSEPSISAPKADRVIRQLTEILRTVERLQRKAEGTEKQAAFAQALKDIAAARADVHALEIDPPAEDPKLKKTALTRMVIGLEQSALAAKDSQSRFVADFGIVAPLGGNARVTHPTDSCGTKLKAVDLGAPWQMWADIRLNSAPQEAGDALSSVKIPTAVLALKANQTVQGLDFVLGTEYRLGPGRCFDSAIPGTINWFTVSVIVGVGATTPLSHVQDVVVFKFDAATRAQDLPEEFDEAKKAAAANEKIQYIALVPPDRQNLFWQLYGGFRFKTDLVASAKGNRVAFPGIIDVTLGKNEVITRGDLKRGWVGKVEGFYPIPIAANKSFYLFGSVFAQLNARKKSEKTALLNPVTDKKAPADDVYILQTSAAGRDLWKIGAGVDLLELFKPKD
jgi:hypothetical protein